MSISADGNRRGPAKQNPEDQAVMCWIVLAEESELNFGCMGKTDEERSVFPHGAECATGSFPPTEGKSSAIPLTEKGPLIASRKFMVGLFSERWLGLRRALGLSAAVLFGTSVGFAQSATVSGSQSTATAAQFQILDQQSVSFGSHTVTFNRIAPPTFPAAAVTPTPAPLPRYAGYDFLLFWATVYDGKQTVIRWWDGDGAMVAVSNIDFDYLGGMSGFVVGDTFYQIIPFLDDESSASADAETTGWLRQAQRELTPTISNAAMARAVSGHDWVHLHGGQVL